MWAWQTVTEMGGGRYIRKAAWSEQLPTYTYLCILAVAEDSSSVYCNSDDSTPIWLLTVIAKEAALWAEVWAEECRRAHQGRPLSLLELWGETEGHTLLYEYADRNLHTSLSTWLLPYAKEPPGSPYFRQHDILTFTLPTVLLSLGSKAFRLARRWKIKKMETFSSGSTFPALAFGVRA